MVPSTRKISTSGGISTKVTCCASLLRRPSFNALLASASAKASSDDTVSDMMKTSSPGAAVVRPVHFIIRPLCTWAHSHPANAHTANNTSSERWPLEPLSSR
jgi:hypothetical protein